MKITRFLQHGKARYGLLEGDTIRCLTGQPYARFKLTGEILKLSETKLLAPCLPSKIIALGLNYSEHAAELKMEMHGTPLIFLKPATALIGPEDRIIYPPTSKQVDYEAELGIVIKKKAHHVPREKASDYILGYTCFNDVTARDLQALDNQWTRAKGFDTFAAAGPCIETELDPSNVNVSSYLNGVRKQNGNTRDLVFPVPELISFISGVMTLLPGDIIATGTPPGVGPMQAGDTIEVKIEGIGTLRNYVSR
jgi:2-keto-4-pentenoate hydratase/2-oxohepta-3-ene-1,7-dioic acid hydratase in catechol pathway